MKRTYGWKKDQKDKRDFVYAVGAPKQLPPSVSLYEGFPPCYDQGNLSSCTANALAGIVQYDEIKQKGITPDQSPTPSRLFTYFNERLIEGDTSGDNGACLRDGVKSLSSNGFCSEEFWEYDEANVDVQPPNIAYSVASQHTIKVYKALNQTEEDLRGCLANGYPFVFGFTVYPNIADTETTGILTFPDTFNMAPEGGHAVVCIGYDDQTKMFRIRNSWGNTWGLKGYFFMPYSYVLNPNLASDFWCINTI